MSKSTAFLLLLFCSCFSFMKCDGLQKTGNLMAEQGATFPYVQLDDKIYLIESNTKMNWFGANHFCRYRHLHLASIDNAREHKLLSDYLVKKGFTEYFWTSANDLEKTGNYKWLATGQALRYSRWVTGQPDNYRGNEHCVNLWKSGDDFDFNDLDCNSAEFFICEARPNAVSLLIW